MFRQLVETAKIVIIASLRKNLIVASWLIMLPLLLAAWLFERSNPGFQTGFVLDAGAWLMSLFAVILLSALCFEHLFWPAEQSAPWFYFSRLKSGTTFLSGKFLGISFILASLLFDFALLLTFVIGLTSEVWLAEPLKIAVMVWAEYSLLLSVLVLLSTFFTRLMSVGMLLPIFFIAKSANFLSLYLPNWLAEILLLFLPNLNIFETALKHGSLGLMLMAVAYALLMSVFYLALAGISLRRRDL